MKKATSTLTAILFLFLCGQLSAQNLKIAVFSDPHYFDTALLINDGPAFQYYLASDRKLIEESYAILNSVVDSLIAESPDIVLIPGDLTKDGALSSHSHVAAKLQQLENSGIKVYVCPGNHDVNNPHALAYDSANVIPVPGITHQNFDSVYNDFGYSEALMRDTVSLSYVAEPISGFQILSLEVCMYDSNYVNMHPTTRGRFRPSTLNWAINRITEARNAGKRIFAMMHHGAMEHFYGQSMVFPEYVIEGWDTVFTQLADAGLEVVFTGHFHSQDIIRRTSPTGNTLHDIETGSLVTWPCPVRFLELNGNTLEVEGEMVEEIDYDTDTLTFQQYAYNYLTDGMPLIIQTMLTQPPYNIPDSIAQIVEPAITATIVTHYGGDESNPPPAVQLTIALLMQDPQYAFLGQILDSIWHDPAPGDWNTTITLETLTQTNEAEVSEAVFTVYPNPSGERMFVRAMEGIPEFDLRLFDASGKLVLVEAGISGEHILDVSILLPGTYVLSIFYEGIEHSQQVLVR